MILSLNHPPHEMSSFRNSLTPPNLPVGGVSASDDGSELVVRGRSFPRSPPPGEIQPAVSPAPAPAADCPQHQMESTTELATSPFTGETSVPEAFAAGLELQPMLSGTAGDSSAAYGADAVEPSRVPEIVAAPALGKPQGGEALQAAAATRVSLMAARRGSPAPAAPGKRNWHAAIRQRLKLRVRVKL